MAKIRKAVIPVAGFGTRFLPVTKTVPKEMLPIVDTPVLHFIVQEAIASGIEEILLITNNQKKVLEDYFDRNYELEQVLTEKNETAKLVKIPNLEQQVKIYFTRQPSASGSGASVRLAADFIGDEYFAVLYGDDLFFAEPPALQQLINVYEKQRCSVLGCRQVADEQKSLYGIIEKDDKGLLKNFYEKPSKHETRSNLASLGRYIFSPHIFAEIIGEYRDGQEVQLTDAFLRLKDKEPITTCEIKGRHYDTGNKTDYVRAVVDYASQHEEITKEVKEYMKRTG